MMIAKKICFITIAFLVMVVCFAEAQDLLTIDEAVKIGLDNNYSIKIAQNDANISANNVDAAKSAFLPKLDLNGSARKTINNSDLTFFNGNNISQDNAKSSSYNGSLDLSWTIFDGLRMFASFDKLKEFERIGETNARLAVQTTVSDIISTYFDIVKLKKDENALQEALQISQLRVQQASDEYFVGTGSKLELLNSKVDLNTDTTNLIRKQEEVRSGKIRLNELLARELEITFNVVDTIILNKQLTYSDLLNRALQQNPQLIVAQLNQQVALLELKELKADRLPTLTFNSDYHYVKSSSEANQLLSNRTQGFNYGLSLNMNLFNGLLQHKQEKNAQITIKNSEIAYNRLKKNLEAAIKTTFGNYENSKLLIQLEEENYKVAQQNLDITLEKFRLGNITQLEVREAQQNYILAQNRYTEAQYNAKLAEIRLKELSGSF